MVVNGMVGWNTTMRGRLGFYLVLDCMSAGRQYGRGKGLFGYWEKRGCGSPTE